ncbi:hypothetical protein OSTOST_12734 [Ostertagia ostertagi]
MSISKAMVLFPKPVERHHLNKRKVLKHVASLYDPLGLFAKITLVGRPFLQSLWKITLSWGNVLPIKKLDQWTQITSTWTAGQLTFPRLILNIRDNSLSEYDLHVFTDASASAHSASSYIVQRLQNDRSFSIHLLDKTHKLGLLRLALPHSKISTSQAALRQR